MSDRNLENQTSLKLLAIKLFSERKLNTSNSNINRVIKNLFSIAASPKLNKEEADSSKQLDMVD